MGLRYLFPLFAVITFFSGPSFPQDKKKPDKKDEPRVIMAIPLGAAPGAKAKFIIRGLKLDTATSLQFENAKVTAKILKKDKAGVPDKNPDKVGDTQIEVEIVLPKDLPSGPLPFTVSTPSGTAKH